MGIRLLSKAEIKAAKDKKREADYRRAVEIHKFIVEEEKAFNAWKSRKDEEIQKVKSAFFEEEKLLLEKVQALKKEVSSLEDARREQRNPLIGLENALKEREASLIDRENELGRTKSSLEEERQKIVSWKAQIADYEAEINSRASSIAEKEEGIKKQKEYLDVAHSTFNKRVSAWNAYVASKEMELIGREGDLETDNLLINSEKEWLKKKQKLLEMKEKEIRSNYEALQDARRRLEK